MRQYFLTLYLFFSIASVSLADSSHREGLAYLNMLRANAGLITLKSSATLQKAAAAHAGYLLNNQSSGHYETQGKGFYTGKTPSERVMNAGHPSAFVMENISVNTPEETQAVDNLFSAIYHRFVFLNMDKDEIGIGFASTNKKRSIKSAYVYNLGSSYVSRLCQRSFSMTHGVYYMKDLCRDRSKMVPVHLFREHKEDVQRNNRDIILYPYAGQTTIWPAFYNESPDPLPGYKVSGFPVSVQFNPAYYQSVRLHSFRLYDKRGKEIKAVKVLHHHNDHNRILSEFEFALMPLQRLEFGSEYTAVFEALADGRKIRERWSFSTVKPKEPLYRMTEETAHLSVPSGSTILLYVVPASREDILYSSKARGDIKALFLDQNTLRVTFPKRRSPGKASLEFGRKKVTFDVQ